MIAYQLLFWSLHWFHRNTSRLFLIASNLFEVLTVFGEVPEELAKRVKYAKWKAIYISRCLKNGETPVPGPVAGTDADEFNFPTVPNTNETNLDEKTSGPQEQPFYPSSVPSSIPSNPMASYPSGDIQSATNSVLTAMSQWFRFKWFINVNKI